MKTWTLELSPLDLSLPICLLSANSCETPSQNGCSTPSPPFYEEESNLFNAANLQCRPLLFDWNNNSSMAAKMGDQYKSMWQYFFHFLSKRFIFFVAVPCVNIGELITPLGDAKHEEHLCLVLKRHSAALWLHAHILYFGMTSACFSTQGWLMWEEIRLWRRKLLWVNCPERHQCHWCCCHGRNSEECLIGEAKGCCAGETDTLLPVWAAVASTQTFSVTNCVLCFFL